MCHSLKDACDSDNYMMSKIDDFSIIIKNVKKSAHFYLFILSENIEQCRKQDSYCNNIRISQRYIISRNINILQSGTTFLKLKTNAKNKWLFGA